jgi:predicted dehydrogenase
MKQVKWGLIGCGDIARKRVAPALRDLPSCDLVALSRSQTDLLEPFAKEFGAKRWFANWEELISDEEISAVYVATPVHLHADQTVAAAEAGKHVLCEKPLALSMAECDRMIAACKANKVKLGVAYYRHFYPVVARIKRILEAGEIGDPVVAQINAFEWFNPEPKHSRAWLLKKELSGGGPMFDFGCHRIEVLLHLFGGVRQMTALGAAVVFDREVEDTATATFQFQRGTFGVLTVTHAACEPQDTLDVYGTRGSIHVPSLNDGEMRVLAAKGERSESHPPAENIHAPLIEDFVAAIQKDRKPTVDGEIGRMVAGIEDQIYGDSI